jgi:hypothetical protein
MHRGEPGVDRIAVVRVDGDPWLTVRPSALQLFTCNEARGSGDQAIEMHTSYRPLLALLLAIAPAACGSDDDDGAGVDAGADAATGSTWQPLITGEWSLPPGSENWYCTSRTLEEDVYIGAFRPIDPVGTHHTLLTYGPPDGPDLPPTPCDPENIRPNVVYASGVNTNALELPDGVGFKIAAGQQIYLNLHVFNTSDAPLTGTSGIEMQTLPAGAVEHEAEMFLPGPLGFQIPQNQEYSYSSNCDITQEQHVFALFPHMHQLGVHFRNEITTGGETRTLWDEDYRFDAQTFARFDPITLQPGDRITTTCTWFYPPDPGGPAVIGWGQSSKQEMCFSIMMRYPRLMVGANPSPACTDEVLE